MTQKYTAHKTETGAISIRDENGKARTYGIRNINALTEDEINLLLRGYTGEDPLALIQSVLDEEVRKSADFDSIDEKPTLIKHGKSIYAFANEEQAYDFVSSNAFDLEPAGTRLFRLPAKEAENFLGEKTIDIYMNGKYSPIYVSKEQLDALSRIASVKKMTGISKEETIKAIENSEYFPKLQRELKLKGAFELASLKTIGEINEHITRVFGKIYTQEEAIADFKILFDLINNKENLDNYFPVRYGDNVFLYKNQEDAEVFIAGVEETYGEMEIEPCEDKRISYTEFQSKLGRTLKDLKEPHNKGRINAERTSDIPELVLENLYKKNGELLFDKGSYNGSIQSFEVLDTNLSSIELEETKHGKFVKTIGGGVIIYYNAENGEVIENT